MFRVILIYTFALLVIVQTTFSYRNIFKRPNLGSFTRVFVSLSDEGVRPCPMAAKCSGQYRKGP